MSLSFFPSPLGGEGGERSEPGEGFFCQLHRDPSPGPHVVSDIRTTLSQREREEPISKP
jgi:hypothetical protein